MYETYEKTVFNFKNRKVTVVFADKSIRTTKWALKTEYFEAFPDTQNELLKHGINLVYAENETRWCKDADLDIKKELADFLNKEFDFEKKCIIIGMSAGGLIGTKFAAKYPDYVSVLYLDAPVLNLLSCPAAIGIAEEKGMREEFYTAMNTTLSELISYRENPIDKMDILIENNIPVILVCGLSDVVVPYVENGKILYDYYIKNGGKIKQILKENCGHHPHGLENSEVVIDFILKYA